MGQGGKIPVTIEPPVNTKSSPEVYLRQRDFDALVTRFGYNIYLDRFLPCPCKEEGVNSPRLTCKNCFGTGFVLAERIQTKAYVASMNYPTQYKDWSIENIGTSRITTLSSQPLSFMDRVILYEEKNFYSELVYPVQDGDNLVAFCAYPPVEITHCKIFRGEEEPLMDIDPSLIEIDNEGRIVLNKISDLLYQYSVYTYTSKTGISLRYTYLPSFHIIDVVRNLITSPTDTPTSGLGNKGQRVEFPYFGVGRMSHLVLERSNLLNLANGQMNNNPNQSTTATDELKGEDISPEFCDTEK